MRHGQMILGELHIAVNQQIEVDGARPPAARAGTVAAQQGFHMQAHIQQRVGGKGGVEQRAGVEKIILIRIAPRRGDVKLCARDNAPGAVLFQLSARVKG